MKEKQRELQNIFPCQSLMICKRGWKKKNRGHAWKVSNRRTKNIGHTLIAGNSGTINLQGLYLLSQSKIFFNYDIHISITMYRGSMSRWVLNLLVPLLKESTYFLYGMQSRNFQFQLRVRKSEWRCENKRTNFGFWICF